MNWVLAFKFRNILLESSTVSHKALSCYRQVIGNKTGGKKAQAKWQIKDIWDHSAKLVRERVVGQADVRFWHMCFLLSLLAGYGKQRPNEPALPPKASRKLPTTSKMMPVPPKCPPPSHLTPCPPQPPQPPSPDEPPQLRKRKSIWPLGRFVDVQQGTSANLVDQFQATRKRSWQWAPVERSLLNTSSIRLYPFAKIMSESCLPAAHG